MSSSIPADVQTYIDAIPPGHRRLFDRLHRLFLQAHPGAEVILSYKMPTYKAGDRRLHVGAWKHGLSVYGTRDRDGGFTDRHPGLVTSKGTIQLRPRDAADIPDGEFLTLARAALEPSAVAGGSAPEGQARRRNLPQSPGVPEQGAAGSCGTATLT